MDRLTAVVSQYVGPSSRYAAAYEKLGPTTTKSLYVGLRVCRALMMYVVMEYPKTKSSRLGLLNSRPCHPSPVQSTPTTITLTFHSKNQCRLFLVC